MGLHWTNTGIKSIYTHKPLYAIEKSTKKDKPEANHINTNLKSTISTANECNRHT